MPIDSNDPLFNGLVYRSRINDIISMSDSNAIGSFTIAELDTQYNDIVDLDAIESRTFDADSDGILRGFTDFSNTINTMDENHWLQVDSDGYGNNMLGYQLDFESEQPGRRQPPIYNIGVSNLQAQRSTVSSLVQNVINASGALEAQVVIVNGVAVDKQTVTGQLEAQASTVVATAEREINASGALEAQASTVDGLAVDKHIASGTLQAQVSTVDGLAVDKHIASGTLQAQVSTVDGAAATRPAITGSGSLQAQVSTVDGQSENSITASGTLEAQVSTVVGSFGAIVSASGTLEAQASTVDGAGETIEPYVGMPFPQIYVGMPFPEIYVDGVIQGISFSSGTLLAQVSEVDGVATKSITTYSASGTLLSSSSEVDGVATQASGSHSASGTLLSSSSGVDGLQPVMLGTYYYDNLTGNDTTGNGSAATPWASIDKVLTDGLVPGYNAIGIDNGPQNPYRINTSGLGGIVYVSNKHGTALNPISLDGDPNSTDYLGGYPDRPTTQYPNTYITNAVTQTGWTLSSVYTNVYEVTNPYPSTAANKAQLFGCTASEWTADGIMAVKRAFSLTWRSLSDPADLVAGEWWCDANKIYYYPNAGENMSTQHMEYCDNKSVMSMKRCEYISYNNLALICVGGTTMSTSGRGVNWEALGEGNGYVNDWCSYISVNSCLFKYTRTATSFNIGEYYFLKDSISTDSMQNGFSFFGSRGDFDTYPNGDPGSNRSFPVSNTLIQNCHVKRTKDNDGIIYHKNTGYYDPNNDGYTRYDDVGSNHLAVNCTSSNNSENGFDCTSGVGITLRNCVTHDNRGAGITVGHYVRNITILNHVSYNDDTARGFEGSIAINDSRNVLIDNLSVYNPGMRSISIRGDAGNIVIKNSKFISGPDTNRSSVVEIFNGSGVEFGTYPRNGSTYAKQTSTFALPNPFLSCATPPVRPQNILIKDNRFDIAFGGIVTSSPQSNYRFKYFVYLEVLPIQGYDYTFEGNVFRTSSNNTQFQPNTASDLPASDYGPYLAKNTATAVSAGGQPVVNVLANQTFFAAGNFPTESDMWNFWPTGVTPVGRDIATKTVGEASGIYNTDIGFTTNDSQADQPLYSSAHNISGQSTYWEPATVQGIWNDGSLPYHERTTWTIAAPSTTATTSRAVGYIDAGVSNVSVQEPWSGDHRVSGGPLVCMNSAVSEFGLSFVWYAGAAGNASYFALFEVGQQPTDRTLKGISAPFPHTDGVEVRLVMEVEDGILRCYAGIRRDETTLISPDNQYSPTLIPLTTTEGGATFSETYDVATNNSNLNGSTTHGVYLYNNQVAASRTANLRYSIYPPILRDLT